MINKLKKYYQIFGLKQTILKIFRYIEEQFHYDKNGIYKTFKKQKKYLFAKSKDIYIVSDQHFSPNSETKINILSEQFNHLGYAVNFICYDSKTTKTRKSLLSEYQINNYILHKLKNSIIIIDSENEYIIKNIESINENNCVFSLVQNKIINKYCKKLLLRNIIYDNYNEAVKIIDDADKYNQIKNIFYNNLSIIILNYNNKEVIHNCIETLQKFNTKYKYEIIVVDNQSTDGSYEEIKKKYSNIKLYRNNKNGCSSGRNIGIKKATKKYVMFLDSDQWILNDNWLDPYLEIYSREENVGAVGWTGGWFNSKGYSYHTVYNFESQYMPSSGLYRKDIGYLGTGGMITTKELLEEIEGFDENYDPTCYEDTDISLKIRHTGREIYYCPYLGVGHKPHQTTKSGSKEHEKLIKQKGDYFISKWKKIDPKLLKYKK